MWEMTFGTREADTSDIVLNFGQQYGSAVSHCVNESFYAIEEEIFDL